MVNFLTSAPPAELRRRAIRSHVTIRMQDREPMRVELAPDESAAPIVTRLVNEGARIEEVRREEPSIEDVFLHLVKRGGQAILPVPPQQGQAASPVLQERKPVFRDMATVIRKEIREITSAAGTGSSTKVNLTIAAVLMALVAVLGALAPRDVITGPIVLVSTMMAFLVVLAAVTDSFPGERERHTLETLLASALPDEALLLGKICASVLYGWALILVILAVIVIGANVTHFPAMYSPWILVAVFVVVPLSLLLFSAAGVLICMRAPTVRAAQPRVTGSFMLLFILLVSLSKLMPAEWGRQMVTAMRSETARIAAMFMQIVFVAVLDVVVMAFALARFRRSRLI
jgi:ABC-2 type transport system permease protein